MPPAAPPLRAGDGRRHCGRPTAMRHVMPLRVADCDERRRVSPLPPGGVAGLRHVTLTPMAHWSRLDCRMSMSPFCCCTPRSARSARSAPPSLPRLHSSGSASTWGATNARGQCNESCSQSPRAHCKVCRDLDWSGLKLVI